MSSCVTQFALIRSVDDVDRITPFKIARSNAAAAATPKAGGATTAAASVFASMRYDYGITLHFKDRAELHLLVQSPVDAWPDKFDLGALEAQLSAAMAAIDIASLLPTGANAGADEAASGVTMLPAPLLSTQVNATLPLLCFQNGDAMRAFEQEETVTSIQRLMDRRQETVQRQVRISYCLDRKSVV